MKNFIYKIVPAFLLVLILISFSGCKKEPLVKEIVGKWQLIEKGMREEISLTPVDTVIDGVVVEEYLTNMTNKHYYNGVWNQRINKYKIDNKHLTIIFCDEEGKHNDTDIHIYEYRFEDNYNYLIIHHIDGILLDIYPQYLWHKYKRIK